MTQLPPGWAESRLQDVAQIVRGVTYSKPEATTSPGEGRVPLLRATNIEAGGLNLNELYYVPATRVGPDQMLRKGDIVVATSSGSLAVVGKSASLRMEWDGTYGAFCSAVRPAEGIDARYLAHAVAAPGTRQHWSELARGSNINNLRTTHLAETPLRIAPLAEQERIVAAIEEAFSLLDAGETALHNTSTRLKRMRDSVLTAAVTGHLVAQDPTGTSVDKLLAELGLDAISAGDGFPGVPDTWCWARVVDVGRVELGRQRHPDWHTGPNMKPYLRVANVFEDRIDTTDVMEMHFEPGVFERFKLHPGDVLLNEGQSPELLGRPALYKGIPADTAFTNSLLRFRAGETISPEWALLVFRAYMRSGRFTRESRITTNIAHLSAGRLKEIEFPIPPIEEQARIVAEVERLFSFIDAAEQAVDAALKRSKGLRRSVLKAAFEGRLVPQDPSDEPASVLLERIAAERGPAAPTQGAPRRVRGKVVAS